MSKRRNQKNSSVIKVKDIDDRKCAVCFQNVQLFICPDFIKKEASREFKSYIQKSNQKLCLKCLYHIFVLENFFKNAICMSGKKPICFMCKTTSICDVKPLQIKSELSFTPFKNDIEVTGTYYSCVVCLYQLREYHKMKSILTGCALPQNFSQPMILLERIDINDFQVQKKSIKSHVSAAKRKAYFDSSPETMSTPSKRSRTNSLVYISDSDSSETATSSPPSSPIRRRVNKNRKAPEKKPQKQKSIPKKGKTNNKNSNDVVPVALQSVKGIKKPTRKAPGRLPKKSFVASTTVAIEDEDDPLTILPDVEIIPDKTIRRNLSRKSVSFNESINSVHTTGKKRAVIEDSSDESNSKTIENESNTEKENIKDANTDETTTNTKENDISEEIVENSNHNTSPDKTDGDDNDSDTTKEKNNTSISLKDDENDENEKTIAEDEKNEDTEANEENETNVSDEKIDDDTKNSTSSLKDDEKNEIISDTKSFTEDILKNTEPISDDEYLDSLSTTEDKKTNKEQSIPKNGEKSMSPIKSLLLDDSDSSNDGVDKAAQNINMDKLFNDLKSE